MTNMRGDEGDVAVMERLDGVILQPTVGDVTLPVTKPLRKLSE